MPSSRIWAEAPAQHTVRMPGVLYKIKITGYSRRQSDTILIRPRTLDNFQKGFDNARIEIYAGLFLDIVNDFFFRPGRPIRTIIGERVKNIHDGERSHRQRDLITFQPARIPAAVPFFMMAVG